MKIQAYLFLILIPQKYLSVDLPFFFDGGFDLEE